MIQFYRCGVAIRFFLAGLILLLLSACTSQQTADSDSPASSEGTEVTAIIPFSENSTIFEILPEESEARFLIEEILNGQEKTVIGKTRAVSGQIAVDFEDPSASSVGPVQINALTLETDSAFRNRAVHTRILLATIYEYVTFIATDITGLPSSITIGEPIKFQIEGDLTITAYTQPIIFDVSAVPITESRLEGQATAVINRTDFDLVVPNATGVASVDNKVTLELDFVAEAGEE